MPQTKRLTEIIYQVYPRTFNDSSGDGHGDLRGIIEKIPYIKSIGTDAIWVSPFYPHPEGPAGDGGYAVSDYCDVNPVFGTLDDANDPTAPVLASHIKRAVDIQESDPNSWLHFTRDLIQWRKAQPALQDVKIIVGKPHPQVFAFIRHVPEQTLLCLYNLSGEDVVYNPVENFDQDLCIRLGLNVDSAMNAPAHSSVFVGDK